MNDFMNYKFIIILRANLDNMKQKILIFSFFFSFLSFHLFSAWTPETVPDPKKEPGAGYVADPDNYLSHQSINDLNTICRRIENETGVQYAIVVLENIDYKWDAFKFGVDLFTHWGIGEKGKDNGLLLLIVMGTRDWRFITGYGLEGLLTDALLKSLGEGFIVPYFREGLYDTGLIKVSEKIEEIVTSEDAESLIKYYSAYEEWWHTWRIWIWLIWGIIFLLGFIGFLKKSNYKAPKKTSLYSTEVVDKSHSRIIPDEAKKVDVWGGDRTLKFASIYMLSAIVPAMSMYFDDFFSNPAKNSFIGLYAFLLGLSSIIQLRINSNVNKITNDNIGKYFTLKKSNGALAARAIFFPFPFLLYAIGYRFQLKSLKNSAVICPICKTHAMPSKDNSLYSNILSKSKLFEKKIKSVDHRIFQCLNMHTVEVPFPGSRSYTKCNSCGTLAVRQTRNRTITHATYSSSGTGEREYTCKFCGNKTYSTYTIPMKTRSSSSSGSGSSGGGGSWGGGRTGGGGAGGRW